MLFCASSCAHCPVHIPFPLQRKESIPLLTAWKTVLSAVGSNAIASAKPSSIFPFRKKTNRLLEKIRDFLDSYSYSWKSNSRTLTLVLVISTPGNGNGFREVNCSNLVLQTRATHCAQTPYGVGGECGWDTQGLRMLRRPVSPPLPGSVGSGSFYDARAPTLPDLSSGARGSRPEEAAAVPAHPTWRGPGIR